VKKVLIITYYWPPSGGAGVQRWLKFAKYLRQFGWEPVIYTPLNPEYPSVDNSLEKDIPIDITVLKNPIWEPYLLYKWFSGIKGTERVQAGFISERKRPGLTQKISAWVRGNLFIPDARCFWIKPSVKFLTRWLNSNKVDAIVSTGPPHSMHLIALGLKKKLGLPWLADFRDPWTQIDFYPRLMLTPWADQVHKKLEKEVLVSANQVVTVSPTCASDLTDICKRAINVITNGYDSEDFKDLPAFSYDSFSITHLGSLNSDRNPVLLWKALAQLTSSDAFFASNLSIQLIGKTDISVIDSLEEFGLTKFLSKTDYLPHDMALKKASQSALLLLALNNTPNVMGITTGKIFEYLALQRPILVVGPENGDAATIIDQSLCGKVVGFENFDKMVQVLLEWKQDFLNRKMELNSASNDQYSRKQLTQQLAKILDGMVC